MRAREILQMHFYDLFLGFILLGLLLVVLTALFEPKIGYSRARRIVLIIWQGLGVTAIAVFVASIFL